MLHRFGLVSVLLIVAISPLAAQDKPEAASKFDVRAHYTKYEYRIPMRDGVRLFTAVYVPKDASPTRLYPFLMERTPYSIAPYGEDHYPSQLGPSEEYEKAAYIFVLQDVRGRYMSEGTWQEMTPHIDHPQSKHDVDESTDAHDTIDWLLKHVAYNNGRVGIWGLSYLGFYAAAGIIDSHPALKAASPQAPVTDLYMNDDAYHNGAFMLAANFGFYVYFKPRTEIAPPGESPRFDYGTTDGYDFFLQMGTLANAKKLYLKDTNFYWDDQAAHPNYDSFWQTRDISRHMKNVHCAVLTVGGWFDAEDLVGPGKIYRAISEFNPGTSNKLVIGPWVHGGWAGTEGRASC